MGLWGPSRTHRGICCKNFWDRYGCCLRPQWVCEVPHAPTVARSLWKFCDCYGFREVPHSSTTEIWLKVCKTKSLLLYSGNTQWANNDIYIYKYVTVDMTFITSHFQVQLSLCSTNSSFKHRLFLKYTNILWVGDIFKMAVDIARILTTC